MCVVKEVSLVGWVGIRGSVRDVCSKGGITGGMGWDKRKCEGCV
jgi:hypothetical protein